MSFVYAAVVGTGASVAGGLIQGKAQSDALDYNAKVQENNARASLISAKLNADRSAIQANKVIGQNIASYGASGVSSDSGSVLNEIAANSSNAELDRMNIIYGGQVRSTQYENQASLDRVASKNVLQGSYFGALGSIARGAAMMYAPKGTEDSSGGSTAGNYDTALGNYEY